jgi:hypothetical protein
VVVNIIFRAKMVQGLTCADEEDPGEIHGNIHAKYRRENEFQRRKLERTNGPRKHCSVPGRASPEVRWLGPR